MRCAAGVLLVGFFAAACTHAAEPESRGSSAATNRPSTAQSSSASPSSSGPTTRDPFQPMVFDRPPGGEDREFFAGEGGIKLALFNWVGSHPHMSTRYRIYGPGWKPRTPLFQVPSVLEILGPVSGGFLGHAFVLNRDGSPRVSKFVLVRLDGTLHTVSVTREKSALLPSDEVLWMQSGRLAAYRPSTGQLRRLRYAETKLPWYASGAYNSETGEGCALADGGGGELLVYWTIDSAHSWKHMPIEQMLGSSMGAEMCEPGSEGRLVLVTSDPPRGIARATTVDLSSRKVSFSYRLDKRFMLEENLLFPIVLADGRLVFPTLRRGLMVATNSTNSRFEFRPGPVERRNLVEVVGREMVNQNWGRRRYLIDVSSDAGKTWHTVDLQAGDWTAAG